MKTWILYLAALLTGIIFSQNLIGQSKYESEVKPQGIVFPRMTTSQQNSLSAIRGQCIYNIDTNELNCYNGFNWVPATMNTSTQNITLTAELTDTDLDTKISVEKLQDEDLIRFSLDGTEYIKLEKNINGAFRIDYESQFENLILGDQAGENLIPTGPVGFISGRENTLIGNYAGNGMTSGIWNTVIGNSSGINLNGNSNTFVGNNTGNSISNTGNNNTFIGMWAGATNQTGSDNTYLGFLSGSGNISGTENVFLGSQSCFSPTSGAQSVIIGVKSSSNVSLGNYGSVVIGYEAGLNGQLLARNVIIGKEAGKAFASTNFIAGNVVLGNEAGYSLNGSNNVFIGNQAGYSEQGNNKLYIEGSNSINPLIYGEFDNDLVKVNGTLHISETAKLTPLTTTPMCTSAEEGLMYFKASDRTLQICKGSLGWKEVLTN